MRVTLAAACAALLAAIPAQAQVTLALSCGAVGIEARLCREGAEAWARETGNHVAMISTPAGSTERLALYQQLLAARSGDIDVLQIDVVWPGILAAHLLDLSAALDAEARAAQFPANLANNTVDGRLVAMPWFTNAGVLYVRRDLLDKYHLPVPETWQALTETARRIQDAERAAGHTRLWGFVFQARAYEGLTVNALEWVNSHGGGTIVAGDGAITIDNPPAATALTRAAGWIGTIAPDGVLNYAEEEARGVFQSGNAVFMRNWPYAWPLMNAIDSPVSGRVTVARRPRGSGPGGRHSATLGGEQLAVSRYSRHRAEAVALVMYLTSRAEQKRRAIAGALNPTIRDLYDDPEVLAANPFFGTLRATFENAVARPSSVTAGRYNQVSAQFWNAVHTVLSDRGEAAAVLERLARSLARVRRDGQW
jgi:trehalose/maltose transport system substrate-binding protein